MLFKPFLEEGAQEDQGHDDHEVPAQAAAPGAGAWISSAETGRCGPGELRLQLPPHLSGVSRSLSAPLTCPADGPGESEAKGAGGVQPHLPPFCQGFQLRREQRLSWAPSCSSNPARRKRCREEERQG